MTTITLLYTLLFYFAFIVFAGGLLWKIVDYARTPQPLKIATTPAQITVAGVSWRMLKELVVFESLFKANKWLWFFGWIFHVALVLALVRHLNLFVGTWSTWIDTAASYSGVLMTFGLAGLWSRRFLIDRIRYISAPSDHLMLALLLSIALSGLAMRYFAYPNLLALRGFVCGLFTFDWQPLPTQPLLLLHLSLMALLMIVFPMSKLLHAPGVFFSPTRNQADNPREHRHVDGWTKRKD
jgi:nitrate reductase gamma subunit